MIARREEDAPEARAPRAEGGWMPAAFLGAWILVLAAGMGVLWRYKSTPGPHTDVAGRWPAGSSLHADGTRPTLVVFVHPCCPCTRATLAELRGFLTRFEGRLGVQVASYRPAVPPSAWDDSELVHALEALNEVTLVPDVEGREAARFGVETSGHVLLYGARGELCYSGGISAARGHLGDNAGLRSLTSALQAELDGAAVSVLESAPVFGCSIRDCDPNAAVRQ